MFNSLGDKKKKKEFFNSLETKNKFFYSSRKEFFFLIKLKNQNGTILFQILFLISYVLLLGIKIGTSN